MPTNPDTDIQTKLQEHFATLSKVVRDAVTSADVEKQLRTLATSHKLHMDQWGALENEVMMALVGIQQVEDLPAALQSELNLSDEEAAALTADISRIVFEPVREQLERELEHPDAKAEVLTGAEAARETILNEERAPEAAAPIAPVPQVLPATPPQPAPTAKAERAPLSSSYTARQPSSERKAVEGDPYREIPR